MDVQFSGDIHHPVAQAIRQQWAHGQPSRIFVNFCFKRNDDSLTAKLFVTSGLRTRLRLCARDNVRYVLVVDDNADPYIADWVVQGLTEFRVNGCVLHLGTVFGDGVPSVVDDILHAVSRRVPIPVTSSCKTHRFVHLDVAVKAVLQYAGSSSHLGLILVQENDGTFMCHSEIAALIAQTTSVSRTHFTFTDADEPEDVSTVFVS
jgi:hypothetical protein